MAEYGFDLVEQWETVSARRLWVLIKNLPASSGVWTGEGQWTRTDELLASIVERVDAWGRLNFVAQGGKPTIDPAEYGVQIKRPLVELAERREQKKERVVETDTRRIAQWFAEHH